MPSFNKVVLMGNLTRDPQLKYLANQTAVTEFGLACNRKFKTSGGEEREEVLFIDCAAFGKQGEVIAEHCQKGKALLVEGRLKFDQWEDKQGGGKRSKISLVLEGFQFVGSKDDSGGGVVVGSRATPAKRPAPANPIGDEKEFEDVPF